MVKQYKALKPVGRWQQGDVVGELTEDQVKKLVAERVMLGRPLLSWPDEVVHRRCQAWRPIR